jgi:hypothetical protein
LLAEAVKTTRDFGIAFRLAETGKAGFLFRSVCFLREISEEGFSGITERIADVLEVLARNTLPGTDELAIEGPEFQRLMGDGIALDGKNQSIRMPAIDLERSETFAETARAGEEVDHRDRLFGRSASSIHCGDISVVISSSTGCL